MTEPQRNRVSSWLVGALGVTGALMLLPSPAAFLPILFAQLLVKAFRANLESPGRPLDLLSDTEKRLLVGYLVTALCISLWVALRYPEIVKAAIRNLYGVFAFMFVVFSPLFLVSAREEWALFREESESER